MEEKFPENGVPSSIFGVSGPKNRGGDASQGWLHRLWSFARERPTCAMSAETQLGA